MFIFEGTVKQLLEQGLIDVRTSQGSDTPEDFLEIYVAVLDKVGEGAEPVVGTGVLTFKGSWNKLNFRKIGDVDLGQCDVDIGYVPPLIKGACDWLKVENNGAPETTVVQIYGHRGE